MPTPTRPLSDARFRRAVWRWLDGTIYDREFARLQEDLASRADARRDFVACVQLHASVTGEAVVRGRVASPAVAEPARHAGLAPPSWRLPESFSRPVLAVLAVAASLTIAVGVWSWQSGDSSVTGGGGEGSMAGEVSAGPVVAKVGETSPDCEWFFERRGDGRSAAVAGSELRIGSAIRLLSGKLRLNYLNGAEVCLVGPTLYEAVADNRGRILYGKCRSRVADSATGFMLETPHAAVTDLGTEFGLEVNGQGNADIVVFDGAVEVDYAASDGGQSRRQSLLAGEAFRLDASGVPVRLASISRDKFGLLGQTTPGSPQSPVILQVEDNLQLSWKFYEIVHAGFGEDAKAFSDIEKEHEWNGLTKFGMPKYLVGCDYVRMFKGDQIRHDIQIELTLDRPAQLFILFDERVPAPRWLEQDFVRTGDRIGLDMGPWDGPTGDEYENSVGPGRSIDRVAIVWKSRTPVDGVVTLGATETSLLGMEMYGIAARAANQHNPTEPDNTF